MKQLVILGENGRAEASIEDVVSLGLNAFRGWHCEAGTQNLYIDFDGKVWIGNCASAASTQVITLDNKRKWGYLGLVGEEFDLPNSNVICPFELCGCGSDIVTTKYKQNTEVKWFLNKDYHRGDVALDSLKNPQAMRVHYPMPKQILWDVGRFCNYSCSYCWPGVHNKTDPHKSLAVFKQTADYLIDRWAEGGQIRWYFGGGEPTLNPDFGPFVDYLASRNQWVMLVSNGSQGPLYWTKNADNYDTLIFSAHFEFMKPELFAKNFVAVAQTLNNNPSRLNRFIVKLMTKPGEIDNSKKFVEELKLQSNFESLSMWARERIGFDMVPLRDIEDGSRLHKDYTSAELDEIVKFNSQYQ